MSKQIPLSNFSLSLSLTKRITALASRIFGVDIALISLVDVGRQWFMSNHGLGGVGGVKETARKDAFCHYTVGGDKDLFIVNDATKVSGAEPNIRNYLGCGSALATQRNATQHNATAASDTLSSLLSAPPPPRRIQDFRKIR